LAIAAATAGQKYFRDSDSVSELLAHKNVPCPMCGGRDRFQFTDKGWGRWYCRGCGEGGDGVRLVERMKSVDFRAAAKLIEGVIGDGRSHSRARP
jgi:putative DNA primase/helicase